MLETEMSEHIGAAYYKRSATRTGQRNGYKPRTLRIRVGTLNLLAPQDRGYFLHPHLLPLPKKREGARVGVDGDVRRRVSTRKVKNITEEFGEHRRSQERQTKRVMLMER